MQKILSFIGALMVFSFSISVHAQVTINNGITGDGAWEVVVEDAGDSREGTIDPAGPEGPTDVIFRLQAQFDIGLDGQDGNLADVTTSPAALTNPGEVTSEGTFAGPNGTINWVAVSTIEPDSPLYTVQYQFSSAQPFGATRIITYFDEDVLGPGGDIVVVIGTPGQPDFQLLTVDSGADVGVALAADYAGANNMTWAGWAIDFCCGSPSTYSIPGDIFLPATTDPRFPDNDVYGPADVTTNFAWDFDPDATTASMTIGLGGSPDAMPPPPVVPPPPPLDIDMKPIPVNSNFALAMLLLLVGALGLGALRKYH